MKPPDKLYVSQLIYETWQYQTPDPDDEKQVEYIRKDALLEWAKEIADNASWMSVDALLNKIESL